MTPKNPETRDRVNAAWRDSLPGLAVEAAAAGLPELARRLREGHRTTESMCATIARQRQAYRQLWADHLSQGIQHMVAADDPNCTEKPKGSP